MENTSPNLPKVPATFSFVQKPEMDVTPAKPSPSEPKSREDCEKKLEAYLASLGEEANNRREFKSIQFRKEYWDESKK